VRFSPTSAISQLPNLPYLFLHNTAIEHLPVKASDWPNLQVMHVPATVPPAEVERLRTCFPTVSIHVDDTTYAVRI
jgi:hypothetical protein